MAFEIYHENSQKFFLTMLRRGLDANNFFIPVNSPSTFTCGNTVDYVLVF